MLIVKPHWVDHQQSPIYSVEVSPQGTVFATAAGDCTVALWRMDDVTREGMLEADRLATLKRHKGAVNCVRFAPNGAMLASASDDNVIVLWNEEPDGWRDVGELRGHKADVGDLCWSPSGKMLASASIDNTVQVWNTQTMHLVETLREHEGWVTGVAWDPLEELLATQSADGTVAIWSARTWNVVKRIKNYFLDQHFSRKVAADVNQQAVFSRLSWSPDGSCLAAPNGFAKVCTTPVFLRDSWSPAIQYVGHAQPTTVVKFNPKLFTTSNNASGVFSLCAIGSTDSGISIWVSSSSKPLAIFRSFFAKGVLDLSWTPDGMSLLACSYEGSVVLFRFTASDFPGRMCSREEQDALLQQAKSKCLVRQTEDATQGNANMLLDVLKIPETHQALSKSSQPIQPPLKVKKPKRIQPMLLSSPNKNTAQQSKGATVLVRERSLHPRPESDLIPTLKALQEQNRKDTLVVPIGQMELQVAVFKQGEEANSMLALKEKIETRWTLPVDGSVVVAAAARDSLIIGTHERLLFSLSMHGIRTSVPILLPAPPVLLSCSTAKALVLCSDGSLHLYTTDTLGLILKCTVRDLVGFAGTLNVNRIGLDHYERPCIKLEDARLFVFDTHLDSWVLADNPKEFALSAYMDRVEGTDLKRILDTSEEQRAQNTVSHLEHMMAMAKLNQSQEEYLYYWTTYCTYLAQHAMYIPTAKLKVKSMIANLTGPVFQQTETAILPSSTLGLPHSELMKQLGSILEQSSSLQDLAKEAGTAMARMNKTH